MDSGDRDLIARRRQEIQDEIERLKTEDRELQLAQGVIERLIARGDLEETPAPRRERPKNHREMVLDALSQGERPWLAVKDIVAHAKKEWGIDVAERSLRPLLTGMKKQGVILRDGRLIALRQRPRPLRPEVDGPKCD